MQDLSHVCDLHHSSRQCWILNPLTEARNRTHILIDTSWVHYHWAMKGTLQTSHFFFFLLLFPQYNFFSYCTAWWPSYTYMYTFYFKSQDLIQLIVFTALSRTFQSDPCIFFFFCNYVTLKNIITTSAFSATALICFINCCFCSIRANVNTVKKANDILV